MVKRIILLLSIILLFVIDSDAITLDADNFRFSINGYIDIEYLYMERGPMVKTRHGDMDRNEINSMDVLSTFDQNHLNLLFDAEKEKFHIHLNLSFRHAYSTHRGVKGTAEVEGGYGEYLFNDYLKIRVGNFLAPVGIYNNIRFLTPLFSTIVLPQMYDPPVFYTGNPLLPDHGNILIGGTHLATFYDIEYGMFLTNGERKEDENGFDKNRDKGVGARIRAIVFENFKVGGTYFTIQDEKFEHGRENVYAGDISLSFMEKVLFEGEAAIRKFEKKKDKLAYYTKFVYTAGRWSPFIAYDHFIDYRDQLFKNGMNRYGIGFGYNFCENIFLKAEYHYHFFNNEFGIPDDLNRFNMINGSAIFYF